MQNLQNQYRIIIYLYAIISFIYYEKHLQNIYKYGNNQLLYLKTAKIKKWLLPYLYSSDSLKQI